MACSLPSSASLPVKAAFLLGTFQVPRISLSRKALANSSGWRLSEYLVLGSSPRMRSMVSYCLRNSHGLREEGVSLRKYPDQPPVVPTNSLAMASPPHSRQPCRTVST